MSEPIYDFHQAFQAPGLMVSEHLLIDRDSIPMPLRHDIRQPMREWYGEGWTEVAAPSVSVGGCRYGCKLYGTWINGSDGVLTMQFAVFHSRAYGHQGWVTETHALDPSHFLEEDDEDGDAVHCCACLASAPHDEADGSGCEFCDLSAAVFFDPLQKAVYTGSYPSWMEGSHGAWVHRDDQGKALPYPVQMRYVYPRTTFPRMKDA